MVIGELVVMLAANNAALTAGLARSEAELKGFGGTAGTIARTAALAMAGIGIGAALFGVEAAKSARRRRLPALGPDGRPARS